MNILYPRIDWRKDGPGYVESEFPVYSWMVAVLYKMFGYHEEIARIVSFLFSALSCIIVFKLSLYLLPPLGAIIAMAVFALNPVAVRLGSAVQPEPLMFAAYLMGIYFFLRWLDTEKLRYYVISLVAAALAVLAKISALHVGVIFAFLSFDRFGWRAFTKWKLYIFAAGVLLPTILWYSHARALWLQFGNSLGISNEAYLRMTSLSFLKAARATIIGVMRIEMLTVWMVPGCVLGFLGLMRAWKPRTQRLLIYWLIALASFYVLTGRTTGESWATYYHIVSTPCAALLMGQSISWVLAERDGKSKLNSIPRLLTPKRKALALALAILFISVICFEVRLVARYFRSGAPNALFKCAENFRNFVPSGTMIAVTGGSKFDQLGMLRAYDRPYMFFWLDCKGFVIANEDLSIEYVRVLQNKGTKFLVAEKRDLKLAAGLEEKLASSFLKTAECEQAILFRLDDSHEMPK
ncbi:MAG: glycosyltransferase family 39 protein [Clostridiales bacterium]|nr:glycosyltransferase family 39 protein [Clostridiales bacterium]